MTPTDTLFWQYLLPILEAQKSEHGVTYIELSDSNGMDRMIEDSVSENVYPGIFVMRPRYTTKRVENHILMAEFNTVFYIWCKEPSNERADQDKAYDHAETIGTSIIQKLQHDSRSYQNFLDFDTIQIEPVMYSGADASFGYEVKMRLGLAANHLFC